MTVMKQGARPRPRITDVAKAAGVSTATVSRALSFPDQLHPTTRQKVMAAIKATGYQPSTAARSLRQGRSHTILVIVSTLYNPLFANTLRGIDKVLSEANYRMLIGNLEHKSDHLQRFIDLAASDAVDGVLLMSMDTPGQQLCQQLSSLAKPMVLLSEKVSGLSAPSVTVDDHGGGIIAAQHLVSLGHKRFAYLSGIAHIYTEKERFTGFCDGLQAAGFSPENDLVRLGGDYSLKSGERAVQQFMALTPRPTAVFAASDLMAIGFLKGLHRHGLKVPDDVSVAGFDGSVFGTYYEPELTTLIQPQYEVGHAGATLILQLLNGEKAADLCLPVKLQLRQTTAAP